MSTEPTLAAVVARGGVAVFAADTVYGLCADAQNAAAVERMLELKRRPPGKPVALAFFALEPALAALPELGERTRGALRSLLPGPLTLLVPNPAGRFPLAGGELLGVRVIDVGLELDRPVLQTSANLAGGPEPRTLAQVPAQIREAADLVLDRGELPGTPSTVVDLGALETTGRWRILREGACTRAEIERALVGSRV
ncbi:MAG TPA: L-threonylcarbamoyladenylate synthase [Solirubrobacteraceae bacterium]|nr:L-threonylcarbamoyladenylate synthase [Solirubrobacteraceae bacterium]